MTKQMENNVDKFKPMKEADYEKLTPAQKKAYDAKAKKAMMGNLPNPPKKKMMDGGMAKMMKGGMAEKPKRGQRAAKNKMMAGGVAKKMKAGGKVRGYGMARGGKVCKMR